MSDLHSAANAVRAEEAQSRPAPSVKVLVDGQTMSVAEAVKRCLPPLTDHQLYVLRCIAEKCAAKDIARTTGQHLATARSLQRRGLVHVAGRFVTLLPAGLEAARESLDELSDDELHYYAAHRGSSFRAAANEILDAREADDASRRTPAGGEA